MAFISEEYPRLEAQVSPLCEDSVDGQACGLWEVRPQQCLHVLCLVGNDRVELGDLLWAEPEMVLEVEEDCESRLEVKLEGGHVS